MNCDINFPVVATVPINASSTPNFLTTTPRTTNVPVGHMKNSELSMTSLQCNKCTMSLTHEIDAHCGGRVHAELYFVPIKLDSSKQIRNAFVTYYRIPTNNNMSIGQVSTQKQIWSVRGEG